jgi:uncharacterized protein YuzE
MDWASVSVSYDREADAAYVYLVPPNHDRRVARSVLCDLEIPGVAMIAQLNDEGVLLGVELLGASRVLHRLPDS